MRRPWGHSGPEHLHVRGVTTHPEIVADASHPTEPGQLWVADLGVAATDSGFLYMAAVLDSYSRRCLGWSTGSRLAPGLIVRAVHAAVARRRSWGGGLVAPHRGPRPDVALALSKSCAAADVVVPPGSSPSAVDGAVAHSFFRALRDELHGTAAWHNTTDTAEAIAAWITSAYNRDEAIFPPATIAS